MTVWAGEWAPGRAGRGTSGVGVIARPGVSGSLCRLRRPAQRVRRAFGAYCAERHFFTCDPM